MSGADQQPFPLYLRQSAFKTKSPARQQNPAWLLRFGLSACLHRRHISCCTLSPTSPSSCTCTLGTVPIDPNWNLGCAGSNRTWPPCSGRDVPVYRWQIGLYSERSGLPTTLHGTCLLVVGVVSPSVLVLALQLELPADMSVLHRHLVLSCLFPLLALYLGVLVGHAEQRAGLSVGWPRLRLRPSFHKEAPCISWSWRTTYTK